MQKIDNIQAWFYIYRSAEREASIRMAELGASGWHDPLWRQHRDVAHAALKAAKKELKECILGFCYSKGVKVFVTDTLNFATGRYSKEFVRLSEVSVWNNYGAVDKKARWLNKVTVRPGEIVSHKVSTDPSMLHPFEEEFFAFMKTVYAEIRRINEEINNGEHTD